MNIFDYCFSLSPIFRFSLVLLTLLVLAGCNNEKGSATSPDAVSAGNDKKTSPVFARSTSSFTEYSSAGIDADANKPGKIDEKDNLPASGAFLAIAIVQ